MLILSFFQGDYYEKLTNCLYLRSGCTCWLTSYRHQNIRTHHTQRQTYWNSAIWVRKWHQCRSQPSRHKQKTSDHNQSQKCDRHSQSHAFRFRRTLCEHRRFLWSRRRMALKSKHCLLYIHRRCGRIHRCLVWSTLISWPPSQAFAWDFFSTQGKNWDFSQIFIFLTFFENKHLQSKNFCV